MANRAIPFIARRLRLRETVSSHDAWHGGAGRSVSTGAVTLPTACPACHSSSITTTARNPDEHTYWRCGGCGEVWNVSRRNDQPSQAIDGW
jgi:hypothetical protein